MALQDFVHTTLILFGPVRQEV